MSAMLASDLHNPQFVGPVNPDSMLAVEFYMHAPEDVHKSQAAGKIVRLDPMPYVRISAPGDNTSIMESPVLESHKRRWPDKWLYFQIQNNMIEGATEIPGWKLEEWTHLDPEQVRELKFLRFTVVEQLANASDSQCQKMGMSGMSLREQARLALRQRLSAELAEEMSQKDAKIEAQGTAIAALQKQMEELLAAAKPSQTLSVPKKA